MLKILSTFYAKLLIYVLCYIIDLRFMLNY